VRWLADECVDAALVSRLRAAGHDASYVAEVAPGATDGYVLKRAHEEGRLLLTEDKDFGDMVFRSRASVPGLVLLRLNAEDGFRKWVRLSAAIDKFGESLVGRHLVIEAARFRSRALPR
jgi:predicted nuclease of predicted toxin-antitoxin system